MRSLKLTALFVFASITLLAVLDALFPPPLANFQAQRSAQLILAADGTALRAFADSRGVWRYPVAENVAPAYLQTLLIYEDRWFYRHPGVNPLALARAIAQAIWYRKPISGGSTITMQVARMIEPIPHTWMGKIKQCARALQLERRLSKSEILQLYLRFAPFGGTVEGVETASRAYLGKPSRSLTDAEAALLVVLPQRPSRLRPDRHAASAMRARDKVLDRMHQQGVWSAERTADAKLEGVYAKRLKQPMLAPLLSQRLKTEYPEASSVQTGINANWQLMAEQRVQSHVQRFAPATSVAVLIVDNETMLARAYVGSARFGDTQSYGHIDMVQATRSPGSTLKPTLYGLALDAALIHSESLLIDAPQDFQGYRPSNFSESFNGPVGAAAALRLSLNVPAVDLLDRLGPGKFYAALEHAGVRLQMPPGAAPNLSLILGGAGANLEQLVGMQAALARKGLAARVRLLASEAVQDRRLMSEGAAWISFQMLAAGGRGGTDSDLFDSSSRRKVAFKTGTSFGFRDAWALGSTEKISIGVWIGRPDGTPNPGSFGAVSALPLLFELFDSLPQRELGNELPKPASVIDQEICWPLGGALESTEAGMCHSRHQAYLLDGVAPPSFHDRSARVWQSGVIEYFADPKTGLRRNASCLDANVEVRKLARWPALAYPWLSARIKSLASLPALSKACTPEAASNDGLVIQGVLSDAVITAPSNRAASEVDIGVRGLGSTAAQRWLLDGKLIGEVASGQSFVFPLPDIGPHRLVVIDAEGRFGAVEFSVRAGIGQRAR
jgi:penicillin-binding protein 1C